METKYTTLEMLEMLCNNSSLTFILVRNSNVECSMMRGKVSFVTPFSSENEYEIDFADLWKLSRVTSKDVLESLKQQIDDINHPTHYNMGIIEPISVIEDWNLNYRLGNVIKYIARAEHKGNKIKDIKKAKWYLDRELENLEKMEGVKYCEET